MDNYLKIKSNEQLSKSFRDIWGLSVITQDNCNLVSILQHHYKHGFKSVQLKLIRDTNCTVEFINKLILEYDKLASFLLNEFNKENPNYLKMILNSNDYFGKNIIRMITGTKISRRCLAGKDKVTICPNGDIYPCDSFVGNEKMKIGDSFCNLYENAYFRNLSVKERVKCSKCDIRNLCGGDCFYNSYITMNSISEVNSLFCKLNKHLVGLALYLICEMKKNNSILYDSLKKEVVIREQYK